MGFHETSEVKTNYRCSGKKKSNSDAAVAKAGPECSSSSKARIESTHLTKQETKSVPPKPTTTTTPKIQR